MQLYYNLCIKWKNEKKMEGYYIRINRQSKHLADQE